MVSAVICRFRLYRNVQAGLASLLLAMGLTMGLAGCDGARTDSHRDTAPAPVTTWPDAQEAIVYQCGEQSLRAFYSEQDGEARLTLVREQGEWRLSAVVTASGAKYVAEDGTVFWGKGEFARLEHNGHSVECVRAHPDRPADTARPGVFFVGRGNEPGWRLILKQGHGSMLETGYGSQQHRLIFASVPALLPAGEARLQGVARKAAASPMSVDESVDESIDVKVEVGIRAETCRDTMSGELFGYQVSIVLGQARYQGCGFRLGDWPASPTP